MVHAFQEKVVPSLAPLVTTDADEFGLHDVSVNERHIRTLRRRSHEIVSAWPTGKLYHVPASRRFGGRFCFIDQRTGLIEFYLTFEDRTPDLVGKSALQVKLWVRDAPAGLTAHVLFHHILGRRFVLLASAPVCGEAGLRFWHQQLREGMLEGFRIGTIDHGKFCFRDPAQPFPSWWAQVERQAERRPGHFHLFTLAQGAR